MSDLLKKEKYGGHDVFFVRFEEENLTRYWIDDYPEGRRGWGRTKDEAFEHAKRVIDSE